MIRRPPRTTRTDTLFPYTTLFRSDGKALAAHHCFGADDAIEGGFVDEAELEAGFLQGQPLFVGVLGDLGGVVVADLGRERGDEHQRAADEIRSEESRVGKECVSTCGSRWSRCQ